MSIKDRFTRRQHEHRIFHGRETGEFLVANIMGAQKKLDDLTIGCTRSLAVTS